MTLGKNFLLRTDSYKFSHWLQYPKNTEVISSYFEARQGATFRESIFFGLQAILFEIDQIATIYEDDIEEAKNIIDLHMGTNVFNEKGFTALMKLQKKQYGLPLVIKAVPEGTPVTESNVLLTIENTHDDFYWLTNYLETWISHTWYPTTVASLSRENKREILRFLHLTGDPGLVDFKLHDFGYRGSTSYQSAQYGAAAHLVNFKGTDTMAGIELILTHYAKGLPKNYMPGFSIPASEHSTITAWGRTRELEAFKNMLDAYPKGLVACVSDSYDIFNACANYWGTQLREQIMNRDGCLVVRPDSGDPITSSVSVIRILGDKFGYKKNHKGYKLLDPHVRMIWGDGVNLVMLPQILQAITDDGWSADNIAFGSGGGLLQKVDRDTQKMAFKCSSARIAGKEIDVYKEPVGQPDKNSKRGKLVLLQDKMGRWTTERFTQENRFGDNLKVVYENGSFPFVQNFEEIRERAKLI